MQIEFKSTSWQNEVTSDLSIYKTNSQDVKSDFIFLEKNKK